jgi:DNA-binding PadR family transcriptional regulator
LQAIAVFHKTQLSDTTNRLTKRGDLLNNVENMDSTKLKKPERSKREFLGEFEQIVLLAILRLRDDDAYGMTIRREIERCTGREATVGAVYITLDRLLAKGYVSTSLGEPTEERGGRAKRFYRVEGHGLKALQRSQEAMRRMRDGLSLAPELM